MTPEQHHAEAERLLGRAMLDDWQPDNDAVALAAVAHAHAALAAPIAGESATVEPDHRRTAEHYAAQARIAELEAENNQLSARLRALGEPVTLADLPEAIGDGDEAVPS
jgi:hypothetical protein